MSATGELRSYLDELRRRMRLAAVLRGLAILFASALAATVILTLVVNRFAFSAASLWSARGVLALALAAGAAFGIALPLWALTRRAPARRAEQRVPEFEQRLLTFAERESPDDPFLELLAADTLRIARDAHPRRIVPDAALIAAAGIGVACLGVLVWLIRSGPGYLGYGAAALWTGPPAKPLYALRVTPGDAVVRRHGDQLIVAQPLGIASAQVQIFARYASASRWDHVAMEPQPRSSGFQFLFAGIPEDLEYYVRAGLLKSKHYHLKVADVPQVRHIRVTYRYPAWMHRAPTVEESGGDLRAVAGTRAELEIQTDRPLGAGALVLDDGRQIALSSAGGSAYRGAIDIQRDGAYHVAQRDGARAVRVSDDYFIEAGEVKPPDVAIARPARDYRASPIEEVTIEATASDPFGLTGLTLHYSVNGGPEKSVALLRQKGVQRASGSALIALESLHLVPGDVVSFYAQAEDARADSRTDLAFIQIDPFEREFSQSQQAGGGGGGGMGNGEAQIAEREKEIISATWKQARAKDAGPKQAAEQAKFLSDVQNTLRSQALALAGRLQLRDLTAANDAIGAFQQEMNAAADEMQPAAQRLDAEKWNDALPSEQKALEHLLRAEATFRQIEVAYGSMGGGSGAVNSAGRDLASLFDLELDLQKNQYETREEPSSGAAANQVDDALRKLDELARREDALADASRTAAQQSAEERWQQEMLRRNAEELRRQLERLARDSQQARAGQQSAQGNAESSAQGDAQGSSSGASQAMGAEEAQSVRQALDRLREAEQDMRRAVDERDAAGARSAAERLREATRALGGIQQQEVARELDALRGDAGRLADEERRQVGQLEALGGRPSRSGRPSFFNGTPSDAEEMVEKRQRLADALAQLEARMRNAERDAAPRSRDAASKVRDALNDLDEGEVESRLQRSADLLRRGYNPLSDPGEADVQSALQHLADQLGQAGEAFAKNRSPSGEDALDAVEQLRRRLAALAGGLQGDENRGAKGEPNGGERNGSEANGGEPNAGEPTGGAQRDLPGRVAGAGGGATGWVNGGWNTGNNRYAPGRAAAPLRTPAIDPEQTYRQGMSELGRLKRAIGEDPAARREVDELIRSMQRLDPRRFPGNPAMVEELSGRVLGEVDRLELQLRHDAGPGDVGNVRTGPAMPVPAGYDDAVADYYRELSRTR